MPLETDEDEYKKYLIDESLPLFDKLNIIIKKGFPIQRQALLNSLNIYIGNSLFKPLIQFIIAEIGTWDTETLLIFPRSLHNILINCLPSINNELFNIIFKHIIISISSGNEKISKEYIFYFDKVIENYTKRFNNGETFPYIIGDDIFEIIFSLGKFGQSAENIRLCCYLSSSMCRLVGHVEENENIQKMFNRICLLFGDLEKNTERQISRELRYLIPIFKGKILEKNDIIKAIKSYINHDWDHAIQTTTIVSLINNYVYINQEMRDLIFDKIKEIFEDANYEDEHKNNIMDTLINMMYNQCLEYDKNNNGNNCSNNCSNYELNDLINNTLKLNFMNNFLFKDEIGPLIIINFDKINIILKHSSIYNYSSNTNNGPISSFLNSNFEEGIGIDNIFFRIFLKIFPKCCNCNNSNPVNNGSDSSSVMEEKENENLKKLLLINLYKMIPHLRNLKYTKHLYEKISNLFKKESIMILLKIYEDEFILNNFSKNYNYLYKLLFCLLDKGHTNSNIINSSSNKNMNLSNNINIINCGKDANSIATLLNENNYYFKLFQNILESVFSFYNAFPKLITCQIHVLLAKTFQKLIKLIYKFYKPYSPNNKDKITCIDKLYDDMYNTFLFHIIKNSEIGNHIKIEYINVFPYLILYGKNRQIYYNFIEDEILKSNQFFTRRCSINFVEKCLNIYSFKLFLKFNFIEIIYYLIHDENNIISASIIEKILFFHKKIRLCSKETLDKICSILSEINILNKDSNSVKHFDIEKNRTIKKILNLNEHYDNEHNKNKNIYNFGEQNDKEEKEIEKIKTKEAKHMSRENEILGKLYQSISLLITVNSNKNNNPNNSDKKFENENKNEKYNMHNDELNQFNSGQKDKMNKRKLVIEKSGSGVIQNINTKNNSKKYLPKLKNYSRKYSCNNNRPFDINFLNTNNIKIINRGSNQNLNLNKLIINNNDKTPEKKSYLKSINNARLPSANSSKARDSFSVNTSNNNPNYLSNHLFYSHNKYDNNLFIDDTNYQMINFNLINKSGIINNLVGYSGKDLFKEIINNEIANSHMNKESKFPHSSKNVNSYLKNGIKGMKFKKESYFNMSNKITINAKTNEINKSNK